MQQFLELDADSGKVQIIMDHREDHVFSELFSFMGATVKKAQLPIGDFICSARCIVERKSRQDFESSVIDGRLFSQLPQLVENYPRVIVIVEGESDAERLSRESLLGTYVSIITDFGASIFFTRDKEKTAELVYAVAKHEQLAKKQPMRLFAKRKALTLSQSQRAIVETFPMIGPKLAKNILQHFGNLDNLIRASIQELKQVEGMGDKRAKLVYETIHQKYDCEGDF